MGNKQRESERYAGQANAMRGEILTMEETVIELSDRVCVKETEIIDLKNEIERLKKAKVDCEKQYDGICSEVEKAEKDLAQVKEDLTTQQGLVRNAKDDLANVTATCDEVRATVESLHGEKEHVEGLVKSSESRLKYLAVEIEERQAEVDRVLVEKDTLCVDDEKYFSSLFGSAVSSQIDMSGVGGAESGNSGEARRGDEDSHRQVSDGNAREFLRKKLHIQEEIQHQKRDKPREKKRQQMQREMEPQQRPQHRTQQQLQREKDASSRSSVTSSPLTPTDASVPERRFPSTTNVVNTSNVGSDHEMVKGLQDQIEMKERAIKEREVEVSRLIHCVEELSGKYRGGGQSQWRW